MHTAVWIVAGLLATVFLIAGANKLFISRERLARAPGGGWVLDFGAGFVKGLGAAELLGAAGLVLPAWLGLARILAPLAAVGLGLVMAGAAVVEFRRREYPHAALNLVYLALAVVVAAGRFGGA
ncbi:DoxX family protein [Streptomyces sp. NBC_01198]|uniref:DoxX family protein n=1 Tax=Streptomyces sp. NBC_01198 TaxID=2903769 RepID=UPI002E144597|nr:DoxX family protein [Streptomyces sp. NBC_01198]